MNDETVFKSILLLTANPKGTSSLRVQEEEREIRERLRIAGYGKVPINSTGATRPRDIQQALLDFKPQIVHFSGHGVGQDGLVFEDVTGHEKLVSSEAIANLFKLFSDRVECVVLNACYSQFQAELIAQHIDYVIGMDRAIGDRAAIEFAVGFYTCIGAGESVEFAYALGCNAIQLEGISEHLTPVIFRKKDLKSQNSKNINSHIDALVSHVRSKNRDKIQHECGTMRMLDINYPIALSDIYTDVNILEQISSNQWKDISDLIADFNQHKNYFDRFGTGRRQKRISGKKAVLHHSKLMILGKPGAGKTTFLQWIAIKCNSGEIIPDYVPVFLRLRNFAEESRNYRNQFDLLEYIKDYFRDCGLNNDSALVEILAEGRALILLDGLDEVSQEHDEIIGKIREFIGKFFKNKYVITCRIATQKYRFQQEKFTDVEVADFNQKQVKAFVSKWFLALSRNDKTGGALQAQNFIHQLHLPENRQICDLAVTPILLNLTCLIFHGTGSFPSKRIRLYERGLNILLVRWDEERGIKRESVYQNLSLEDKLNVLCKIAASAFEKDCYFFEKNEIVNQISNYLRLSSLDAIKNTDLNNESNTVLKSIELQHGLLIERAREVYSFSHLTFQEYFTAKKLFDSAVEFEVDTFRKLIGNITKFNWNEVWQMLNEMSWTLGAIKSLQRQMELMEDSCPKLQAFLGWASEKSVSVTAPYKLVAIRSFYFSLFAPQQDWHPRKLSVYFAKNLDQALSREMKSDDILADDLVLDRALMLNRPDYFGISKIAPELSRVLQGKSGKEFEAALIKNRNIGHRWGFTTQQENTLRAYCNTILVMSDQLNNSQEISFEEKKSIEESLFLPRNK